MKTFTDTELRILKLVQGDLPDSLTPFADIARQAGTDEATVLGLLERMKADGSIRRFGVSLKHQKAGYGVNAMVAWRIAPDERLLAVAPIMSESPNVSHCYWRREQADWPYNLYTMVHAKSREECLDVIRRLSEATGESDYAILNSIKELKKISMTYF
ncbi:MAG: Lrp/AsnC family transcriptional regulator [Desulfovibrionaceae bacterium]|jgi:DNA-binding Lrp family transcriptional regulator|nr:Lrp/AsnC family transcriptional regulator [Desulfovibrionaceae bacterium]